MIMIGVKITLEITWNSYINVFLLTLIGGITFSIVLNYYNIPLNS